MKQQKARPTFCKNLQKASKPTPMQVYCAATILCLAALLFAVLVSHGDLVNQYFFYDTLDTGMDFFHSIEYVKGRMPYGQFSTLYPPLANLFFYGLYQLVPKSLSEEWQQSFLDSVSQRGSQQDLRLHQGTMMLFILFVVLAVLGIAAMTERLTRNCGGERKLLSLCAVFSYGVLYGLERGNLLLLCWPLMAFFIVNRKSKNPVIRELSYIALAIAAGFKLYPAFLGILLLRDKNYMAAVRTVIYGIVCLCFPLFFFNEGMFGLTLWFRVLFGFTGDSGHPWIGNGFANIVAEFAHGVDMLLGTSLADGSYALLGILLAAVLLVCALRMDREWKRVLAIVLAMVMFQSQYDYVWCLFLLPLCVFFAQENELNKENIVPYLLMVLLVIPLPLFRADELTPTFTIRNTLGHIMLIMLLVWCIAETARRGKKSPAPKAVGNNRRQLCATAILAVCMVACGFGGQALWENTHNWGFDYSYNGRIGDEGVLMQDVQDSSGNTVTVQWSGRGAYVIIYNHAPFAQEMTIEFETGYGMDLQQAHTMTFTVEENTQESMLREENPEPKSVKIEREGQKVTYTVSVDPGQTKVELSYDGPMAVYDENTRKNGTFSVKNLTVTSAGKPEETA